MLAALSSQPEVQASVHVAVLLAPVAFAQQMSSLPLRGLSDLGTQGVGAPVRKGRGGSKGEV